MKQIKLNSKVQVVRSCFSCPCQRSATCCNFGVHRQINTFKIPEDCPLEDAPCDNYVLRCKAHLDIACNNRTASGDCSAPKLHCVYALEVKV